MPDKTKSASNYKTPFILHYYFKTKQTALIVPNFIYCYKQQPLCT